MFSCNDLLWNNFTLMLISKKFQLINSSEISSINTQENQINEGYGVSVQRGATWVCVFMCVE